MSTPKIIRLNAVPYDLMSSLEHRDVALWVRDLPKQQIEVQALLSFLGLPWRLILSEYDNDAIFAALGENPSVNDPMTRRRGFVQIIDRDPSQIELPERCLPVYLLESNRIDAVTDDFSSRLTRMTMLEQLRRSGVRQLLIISHERKPLPDELLEIWASGYRSFITIVSDNPDAPTQITQDAKHLPALAALNLLQVSAEQFITDVLAHYANTYPETRNVIRVRDPNGAIHAVDITSSDDPERPILGKYVLIEERNATSLMPEELDEAEFVEFFQNPEASWRPYAAGLPWIRDSQAHDALGKCLNRLVSEGSEANCVAYISSESGAGGTTLARTLAWDYSQKGFPVLLAKPVPFVPDALPIANYLNRANEQIADTIQKRRADTESLEQDDIRPASTEERRYEVPWLIVFDNLHWQYRDSELTRFRNELEKSGRPVCMLVVTGPMLGVQFYNTQIFKQLAQLNHSLTIDEARELGAHLNRFLRNFGKDRSPAQWERFYEEHTVQYLEGLAAFWVTLSFWIQGQYDLTESIQEWIYRAFRSIAKDHDMQGAILEIAALSSERLPLPEHLLPQHGGEWPLAHLLEDERGSLAPLGLTKISVDGEKYWALVHDVLGRFLINALFYDFETREILGLSNAIDAEHLRFLLLKRVSAKRELGERSYRSLGEDFATTIFKIDPGQGRGNFAYIWREVLAALDGMPQPLRDTSRVFRHHSAISRRRVSHLEEKYYNISDQDRVELLGRAIEDIQYALNFIEYSSGSEPNLNLLNSLANAYLDLAQIESRRGASAERLSDLRRFATEATSRAYRESPTNSFVIETYVKNILAEAENSQEIAIAKCVEALGILFSAISADDASYRRMQLGDLADRALGILFSQPGIKGGGGEFGDATEVLVAAWLALTDSGETLAKTDFSEVPEDNRKQALAILETPVARGNMQVIRLQYDLFVLTHPLDYRRQLELVEQLQATDARMTPQLRLEYAILLYFNKRAAEGERVFRSLRRLWRESEHFVNVPERLRWLRTSEDSSLATVRAVSGSDEAGRALARVQEFANSLVPYRPEEFGYRAVRAGTRFSAHVSFGYKGPLLRPVTAGPTRSG